MFVNIVLAAFDVYIGKKNLSTLRLIISSKVIYPSFCNVSYHTCTVQINICLLHMNMLSEHMCSSYDVVQHVVIIE